MKLIVTLVAILLLVTGTTSAAIPQNSRICTDWHAHTFTAESLGDSVAEGYNIPANEKWTAKLQAELPSGSAVWNGAVGGSLIEHYMPGGAYYFHVQFVKQVKPTVVFLNWRLNEQAMATEFTGYTPTNTQAKYMSVINDIKSASPNTTFVIVVSPWAHSPQLTSGTYSQWDYIFALWQVKEQAGALWLDWMRYVSKPGEAYNPDWIMPDLVHPTVKAQRPMAAAAFGLLDGYCQST
jgi:lysophospholipase L1-like esterase